MKVAICCTWAGFALLTAQNKRSIQQQHSAVYSAIPKLRPSKIFRIFYVSFHPRLDHKLAIKILCFPYLRQFLHLFTFYVPVLTSSLILQLILFTLSFSFSSRDLHCCFLDSFNSQTTKKHRVKEAKIM